MSAGRPAFQPPDQPGVDLPAVPPSLHADAGTLGAGDRLRYWIAFAGLLLGAAGLGWRTWHGLADDGWPVADTLFLVGAVELALLLGVTWFGLPLIADVGRIVYQRREWTARLTAFGEGAKIQRETATAYARRWYGADPQTQYVAVNDSQVREELAGLQRAIAQLQAQQAAVTVPAPPAGPQHARVEAPPLDAADTRPMTDPRALLGTAYRHGPTRVLIAHAWANRAITHEAMAEGTAPYMQSAEWKDVTALLGEVGILVKTGKTRPWQLAPAYRQATETETHRAVLAALWTAQIDPNRLPGDLHQRDQS